MIHALLLTTIGSVLMINIERIFHVSFMHFI